MSQSKHVVAANNMPLAVGQSGTSDLTIYFKRSVDAQFESESITPERLKSIISTIESNARTLHSDEDKNLIQTILFFVIKDKLSALKVENPELATLLHAELIDTIEPQKLIEPYSSMLHAITSFQNILAPVFVGRHSEAKKRADEAKANRKKSVEQWVVSGQEKKNGDLKKYLAFVKSIHEGEGITEDSLQAFKSSLTSQQLPPFAFEQDSSFGALAESATHAMKYQAATVLWKDIEGDMKVSPEEREEIKQVFDLICADSPDDTALKTIEGVIKEQHRLQLAREVKEIPAVLKRLFSGEIQIDQAMTEIGSALNEPFKDLNHLESVGLASKKLLEGLSHLIIFVIKANLQLAANAIIKPLEAGKQFGKMCFDVADILYFFLKACHTRDPERQAAYQVTCTEKCANLTYNTRKFLEATLASLAVGFVILANVTTFGVVAPTFAGVHALTTAHTLSVISAADNVKTSEEYLEVCVGAAESSAAAVGEKEKFAVIQQGHDLKAQLADFKTQECMKSKLNNLGERLFQVKASGYS
ncbi:MAG: hypothetical protein K0U24_06655 [Gammaproteobacteria bacterium]|nr:hypothetical protein [Gammaproteobacteria bacterium]MCH9763884.1 hypothetical protein [Gammaproteobacteria bacterium]